MFESHTQAEKITHEELEEIIKAAFEHSPGATRKQREEYALGYFRQHHKDTDNRYHITGKDLDMMKHDMIRDSHDPIDRTHAETLHDAFIHFKK